MTDPTAPMRIAYLTGEYPRATDTFVLREIFGLRQLGHDVMACSIRRTDAKHHVGPEQKAEAASTFYVLENARGPITLIRAHVAMARRAPRRYFEALGLAIRTSPPGVTAFLFQIFYFLEAGVLAQKLLERNISHLHNHFANSSCSVAMLASVISGVPFSFTIHGPAIFFEPRKWRIDEKIRRATFVSCISHFCRSQAMLFSDPAHWRKLHIVHCGVDPDLYTGERSDSNDKSDGSVQLLFVGRLDAIKGVRLLIDAVKALAPRYPGVRLALIGDGADRAALEDEVHARALADRISFEGYQSQASVADYLRKADIFVLPSFAEGVPVVLMEALAAETPVVASAVAGVGELVEEGASGFLIPPGDVESLKDRISRLIDDPALRQSFGAHGRRKVKADFNGKTEVVWLERIMRAYASGMENRLGLRPATGAGAQIGPVALGEPEPQARSGTSD